jgi:quercetin dioxygenase-like cupin family protein
MNEELSYWQPLPANGYVTVKLHPGHTGSAAASMGTQNVAPRGFVREHSHVDQEEIIFVLEGRGTALIEGERHPMVPGACLFLGKGVRHSFINDGDVDLRFTWTIMPGQGLHEYFSSIGRPRIPGEPAPEPFQRPDDDAAILKRTGFNAYGKD